ncbi:MAG TPA: SDR family NAD(P)-dependent oxidoreductase [Vicinamibacterales bacterium]|nr:SDR family NAD(P)-dependent oxidoreductase [Vicinamibacterales bacterium]
MSLPDQLLGLGGSVALVAGGGGAIGGAIAVRLRDAGARVFCLDLPGRDGPAGTTTIACDLTRSEQVADAVTRIGGEAGRLDVVVHAAGITRDARLWKLADEDWNTVIATNLDSAFYLLKCAVPLMRRTGPGSIVLVSSINGQRGKVGLAAYSASKAGLDALARTAARELGGFGIRVNAVAPGWIDTPMTARVPEEIRRRAVEEGVLGRLGEPDEVADAVWFLASRLGRYVTGQVLRVDGGQHMG